MLVLLGEGICFFCFLFVCQLRRRMSFSSAAAAAAAAFVLDIEINGGRQRLIKFEME